MSPSPNLPRADILPNCGPSGAMQFPQVYTSEMGLTLRLPGGAPSGPPQGFYWDKGIDFGAWGPCANELQIADL